MAIIEKKAYTKITIDDEGNVAVRESTVAWDDVKNEAVGGPSLPHTRTYMPGDNISGLEGIAFEVCEKVHTPERKAATKAMKDAEDARMRAEAKRRQDAITAGQNEKPRGNGIAV